jgi:assimilatory nitrate reductase catalytic subunit
MLSKGGRLPSRDWLAAQLSAPDVPSATELLAARPAQPREDVGEIVCACFDVGIRTITRAIAERRLVSVDEVGQALRAGTNCGSCRTAIHALLQSDPDRVHA